MNHGSGTKLLVIIIVITAMHAVKKLSIKSVLDGAVKIKIINVIKS